MKLPTGDSNTVTPLDFVLIERADIVGVTGMSAQRFRAMEILKELKARNTFTVVGGPWITVQEDYFGDLVDVCPTEVGVSPTLAGGMEGTT